MSISLRSVPRPLSRKSGLDLNGATCPMCEKGLLKTSKKSYRLPDGFMAKGILVAECPVCKELYFPPGSVDELQRQRQQSGSGKATHSDVE